MASFGIPYPNRRLTGNTLRSAAVHAASLGALIALAAAGTAIAGRLHAPVPGTILAAVALVVWLARRPNDVAALPAADKLVAAMPLLFVPLIVEAVAPLRALGAALLPFALTTVVATLAALAAAVFTARLVAWLSSRSR